MAASTKSISPTGDLRRVVELFSLAPSHDIHHNLEGKEDEDVLYLWRRTIVGLSAAVTGASINSVLACKFPPVLVAVVLNTVQATSKSIDGHRLQKEFDKRISSNPRLRLQKRAHRFKLILLGVMMKITITTLTYGVEDSAVICDALANALEIDLGAKEMASQGEIDKFTQTHEHFSSFVNALHYANTSFSLTDNLWETMGSHELGDSSVKALITEDQLKELHASGASWGDVAQTAVVSGSTAELAQPVSLLADKMAEKAGAGAIRVSEARWPESTTGRESLELARMIHPYYESRSEKYKRRAKDAAKVVSGMGAAGIVGIVLIAL